MLTRPEQVPQLYCGQNPNPSHPLTSSPILHPISDYFYRVNDDTEMMDNWPTVFVKALQSLPQVQFSLSLLTHARTQACEACLRPGIADGEAHIGPADDGLTSSGHRNGQL